MDIEKLLSELFEAAYIVDEDRKILFWNKQSEEISGYSAEEIVGKYCFDNTLRHVDENGKGLCHDGCPLFASLKSKKINVANVFLHHKDGYRVPVNIKTIPFFDKSDGKYKAVEIFTDLQDEKKVNQENKILKKEVLTDPLTEVYNRRFLDYQIDTCITEHQTFGTSLGLLFIDIDYFKNINDLYGHDVGDIVLKTIAKNIKANIRQNDFVGRFGGEEFVVILRDINKKGLLAVAEKLKMLIKDSTINVNGNEINLTISIGTSIYQKNLSRKEFVRIADLNMYKAKSLGRNRVC